MAIREQLILDASEALAQAERLERALREAVSIPPGALGGLEASLRDASADASRLESELRAAASSASGLDTQSRQAAQGLGAAETNARQLSSELTQAASASQGMGAISAGAGRVSASLGRLAVGAAAAFGVSGAFRGISSLVGDFAAFDDALNQSLAIVSGVTPAIREQFAEVARTVGEDTRFSATEAAEGFFFLASAGFDAAAQLEALPVVARFAQAGMFDLATATELAASAQAAIGLSVDDAAQNLENLTRVADVLVEANNLSSATTEQFAEALTNRAAAAARTVGIELEETVAVLAAFATVGRRGQVAGESFTIVLRDLQRAARENPQAFRDLGVAVFDAAGEFLPFADIIGGLEQALNGMDDATRGATLSALGFQEESVANIQLLLGQSEAVREFERALRDAGGASEELAERQLTSLTGRLEIAKGQIDDAKLSIGEALVPAIEALADAAPQAADAIEDLTPSIAGFAASLGQFVSDPGTAGFVGFLADLPRGLGQVIDTLKLVPTFTTGLSEAFGGAFASAVTGDLEGLAGAFDEVGASVEEFRDNTAQRIISQRLIGDLRAGTDATLALANALAGVKQVGGVIDPEFIDAVTAIAGTDLNATARALDQVRDSADRLGLSAAEVDALDEALDGLSTEAREARDAQREAAGAATGAGAAMGAAAGPIDDMASSLSNASGVASGAGGVFFTLGEAFDAAAEGVAASAASVQDSLDAFSGGVELLDVSAADVIKNLQDQLLETASFETNVGYLIAAGFENLGLELLRQGPGAARAASEFLSDFGAAAEANALLGGALTPAAQAIVDQFSAALTSAPMTREAADAFAVLLGEFDIPQIGQAVLDAFPTETVGEAGAEAGRSYVAELAEVLASEGVSASLATSLAESLGSQAVADAAGVSAFVPGESYTAELAGRLAGEGMSGAAAGALAQALASDAVREAARAAGELGGSAYVDGLLRRLEEDRESIGSALGGSFGATAAIGSAEDAGARAAQAWIEGARGPKGFKFGSPSKIAVDIGRQLASDLSGAFSTNLALNVPAPTVNNNVSFSFASGRDAGRAAAIAGQVTGLLGVVRR